MKYCKNCGWAIDDDALFCTQCGTKQVTDEEQNANSAVQPTTQPIGQPMVVGEQNPQSVEQNGKPFGSQGEQDSAKNNEQSQENSNYFGNAGNIGNISQNGVYGNPYGNPYNANYSNNYGSQSSPNANLNVPNNVYGGQGGVYNNNYNNNNSQIRFSSKSKVVAGLLGIFLGVIGVHNFYLGRMGRGMAQLLISILTCGMGILFTSIWSLIEGIMCLAGNYTDADGLPLRD